MKTTIILFCLLGAARLSDAQDMTHRPEFNRSQLSVMVVPYTSHNEDILSKIENDEGYRAAISDINRLLIDQGYRNTLDFKTFMDNQDTGAGIPGHAAPADKMKEYIEKAPVDIIIAAEILWTDPPGDPTNRQVKIFLKAVDKYTSAVYADNAAIQSGQRAYPSLDYAVRKALTQDGAAELQHFLHQLDTSCQALLQQGRQVNIRFSGNSTKHLTDRQTDGERLSDKIENCIKQNAFKGQYKVLGLGDSYMSFAVQIPLQDDNGNAIGPSLYIRKKIDNYFFNLGIQDTYSERGQWIYFTLTN